MAKTKVNWNERLYKEFISYGMLGKREQEVLRMRIMEYTVTEIAESTGWSKRTVNRVIDTLLRKYNEVYRDHPDVFPAPKLSAKEKYMNTH